MFGEREVLWARYQCSVSGKFYCPADELLDLPAGAGGVMTVSLSRRALALSTRMDFHELQRQLLEQHDVSVSDTTLDVLMRRAGGVAEADRQKVLDALSAKSVGVEREEAVVVKLPAPKRMYVSCDGIFYPTRYKEPDPDDPEQNRIKYQEMKVGTIFWQDQKNRWHKRVVSGRDDSERFGLAYREKGYVIGSGMMESTCKQVVSRRLKGPGMQWSECGALAIAALIGQRINGSWEKFWLSRPLQRAA